MAVLSSVPFIQQSLDGGCGCDFDALPRLMESCQITPPPEVVVGCEGKIYVAVGKNLDDGKSCLLWASKNFGTKRIFLLHVHQPAQLIPAMGGKFPANKLDAQEVNAHRDHEKRKMHKILNEYVSICAQHGVLTEKLYIEMDNIEKGIVELVAQHGIERLIMGSSIAGKSKINTVKSKKAIFVSQEAHKLCHIWFICKGCLIQTREGILENPEIRSCESSFSSSSSETSSVHHLLQSITGQSSPVQKFIHGDISHGRDISRVASLNGTRGTSMPRYRTEDVDEIEEMFNSMQQAMVEVENAKREAREELFKRRKAEKNALEAIQIAKESERLYSDLIKQNKEMKVLLSRNTSELDRIKKERDELKTALDQKMVLERQIADFERLFVSFRLERDKLQLENDNTVHEAQILGERGAAEATSSQGLQFFSFSEIGAATCNFDPRLIIGGGGYGTVYKGFLRNTDVAIKLLDTTSLQGCSEFQQEVDVLSGMRHPNLVTLIGTCPEAWSLVYEYLPNGNLKDRLACKENTSPLSWKSRIRIAAEICSALIFLHSYKPHGIVHGDLKPANVLLDANLISKLGDFGISRSLTDGETSTNSDIMCYKTNNPKGTPAYIDPEFLSTGNLTPMSDVYSFGIVLLQLLTGRPPLGIAKEVQLGLDGGSLGAMLDTSAGNWPFVQAKQIACLGLRCCERNRENRPDLISQVWKVFEPMKASWYSVE